MNFQIKKVIQKPILLLIAVNILAGVFTFRDYGTAWDEPLFYSYGDALGYAYSPQEWFSSDFDLYNSYGASGGDHRNRGPAYLLLARNFVYGVRALGSPATAAWHLVNFLFFQLGIYLLYRFSKRWMSGHAAFFTALFFSLQPLLWGHAFINPKDPPFLTFFLGAMCFGFEMVDAISEKRSDINKKVLLASFFLGIATSIRILGPLAGLLVFIYFLAKGNPVRNLRAWRTFVLYGAATILIMFATWPYLWEDPFGNFIGVFRFMSNNPTQLGLLFEAGLWRANILPARYFPSMLTLTLTEPSIPLFLLGILSGYWVLIRSRAADAKTRRDGIVSLTLVLAWFLVLIAYILIRRPSMYDGIRHFLFILPPVFVFIGLAFEFLMDIAAALLRRLKLPVWLSAGLGFILIVPGMYGIVKLHPYQYTYYNFYIGGTNGAFRAYETDYWLTCYKDAVEELNEITNEPVRLFVKREAYLAVPFANENVQVLPLRDAVDEVRPGDYVLSNSRTNDDMGTFPNAPVVVEISRVGAKFCTIRRIP